MPRSRATTERTGPTPELPLFEPRVGPPEGSFVPVELPTSRGMIACRHYVAPGSSTAALFVGGAGGGFDTPVRGWLYPRLCEELPPRGIAALRVRYRHPADLAESTLDVLAGLGFLKANGAASVVLVGHSFGGAVVIQAAAADRVVRGVAPLSTQSHGAHPVSGLAPRCSVLLMHGTADEILPPSCSRWVYDRARGPRRLVLLKGARHGLDEADVEVHRTVLDWIVTTLREVAPPRA